MSGKKLINNVDAVVDDCLAGVIASRSNLTTIKNRRVVVRSDIANSDIRNRVAIVCGGGSGHEPCFAGYVGKGMLDAAVAGSVFTSPPVEDILSAIAVLASYKPKGILVVIINYTGDRINFGLAIERAKSYGFANSGKIDYVTVGEDCALQSQDRTAGRRGLSGCIMAIKIAGALAERGNSLQSIVNILEGTVFPPNLGTIGLSLTPCTLPGRTEASFSLASDEMVLGLGVHGESGVKKMKMCTAKETVKAMLDHMTSKASITSMSFDDTKDVAVLINNLGSVTNLEMGILTNEVICQLEEAPHNLNIRRIYVSPFMTSLEMAGFSISILKINGNNGDELLSCLESPSETLGWSASGGLVSRNITEMRSKKKQIDDPLEKSSGVNISAKRNRGPNLSAFGAAITMKSVEFACEALISCENQLNTMDSGSGDSDCGSTLRRGAEKLMEAIANNSANNVYNHLAVLFGMVAEIAEKEMGGSSGAMYSIFFESASSIIEKSDKMSLKVLSEALDEGLANMRKYGRASPGDRTMIDAMHPALLVLREERLSATEDKHLNIFEKATQAAEQGAKDTVKMKASAGRASYVAESELKYPDPGAHAIGIIMRAVFEGYKIKAK
jgi:dihydroxyacetone kinase